MNGKVFVGLDAGCSEHEVVALDEGRIVVWSERLPNNHDGCDQLLEQLKNWASEGLQVWIGAEGFGGYLSPFDRRIVAAGFHFVGFHPRQVKKFREMAQIQPDKSDSLDARLLAEMLVWLEQRGDLAQSPKVDAHLRALREAGRAFQAATDHKTALQNRLVSKVREYWPELVVTDCVFSATDARGLLRMLAKYPTPESVAKAGSARVSAAMGKGRNNQEKAERAVAQARKIRNKVEVSSQIAMVVREMATDLLVAVESVTRWEQVMREILETHPFGAWLISQQGISVRTAGCFLGETGSLDRFATEAKLARYAGNGAVLVQSGAAEPRHYDAHRYNHRLKRASFLMAACRAQYHEDSRAYVERRKSLGDNHWEAIKKLARHILRLLWRTWQDLVNGVSVEDLSAPQLHPLAA